MILYNVTVSVDTSIETEWLKWMKEIHIPAMMETGCFQENKVLRLLSETPEEGATYAVQYFSEDQAMVDHYLTHHARTLRQAHTDRFGDATAAFRTLLEEV